MHGIPQVHVVGESPTHIVVFTDSKEHFYNAVDHFCRETTQKYSKYKFLNGFGERSFPEEKWRTGKIKPQYAYVNPPHDDLQISIVPLQEKPLVILDSIAILQCIYGPDNGKWQKKKYAKERDNSQNVDHPKPRNQKCFVFSSRKKDCPAEIRAKEVFVLLEEQVQNINNNNLFYFLSRNFCIFIIILLLFYYFTMFLSFCFVYISINKRLYFIFSLGFCAI